LGLNPNAFAKGTTQKERMHGFIRLNKLIVKRCFAHQTESESASWLRPWVKPVPLTKNEREVWFSLTKHVVLSGTASEIKRLKTALVHAIPKDMLKGIPSTKHTEAILMCPASDLTVPRDPEQAAVPLTLTLSSFNAMIAKLGKQFAGRALLSPSEAFAALPFEDNDDPLGHIAMQHNFQEALLNLGFKKNMSEQCKFIWEQALKSLGVRFKTRQTENTIKWVARLLSKTSTSADEMGG